MINTTTNMILFDVAFEKDISLQKHDSTLN